MIVKQDFEFTLDERLAVVWIDYKHEGSKLDPNMRYRVNCMDICPMNLRARYWFAREFPQATDFEKADFSTRFVVFYEVNKDAIDGLAREIAIKKRAGLFNLLGDVKQELFVNMRTPNARTPEA